ncbi:MAG: SDR family NAD(P)-dependent oxidoreductase, partial [Paracoccaceae bacterium]
MTITALSSNSVAVITGAAAGIGLAISKRFASIGMRIVAVDNRSEQLGAAVNNLLAAGASDVLISVTDVSDFEAVRRLEGKVAERFGGTDILVNNAGIQPGSSMSGPIEAWRDILGTNLWGVIHGTKAFLPRMIERGRPGIIINTGSKQGITTPPGDPAYNVTKAGVKAFTEALEHELRNTEGARLSAHLLIPGFVFTDLNRQGR